MSHAAHKVATLLNFGEEKYPTAAVILAAGSSTRMGAKKSKQFLTVNNVPVLAHTLMAYQNCPHIRQIIVVARQEDFREIVALRKEYGIKKLVKLVAGGKTRQESAKRGVAQIDPSIRYVAIADGARCLTTPEQISKVCRRAYAYRAASAAHLISSSVKRASALGTIAESVDRTGLWSAQTPQVFHTALYQAALYKAANDRFTATDDNELIQHLGYEVKLVECGRENIKITTPDDLTFAKMVLDARGQK